ncbi:esterase family protein [bacterium]|nr:MAG: esterase family protein [bacterium]
MHHYTYGWYSERLNRQMDFQHFGHAGAPIIVFPTTLGNHYEFSDRNMIDPIVWKIEQGLIQVFCVNSINNESWYNNQIHPHEKVKRHVSYEEYLIQEFFPYVRQKTGTEYLVLFGCSFGGFHAINFTLRHPELVDKAISLSGSFTIEGFLNGYYDDLCYYNNPAHYMQNMRDPYYIDRYNHSTELSLVTSDWDVCRDRNEYFHKLLTDKGIRHNYYFWDGHVNHDWPSWQRMIGHYL